MSSPPLPAVEDLVALLGAAVTGSLAEQFDAWGAAMELVQQLEEAVALRRDGVLLGMYAARGGSYRTIGEDLGLSAPRVGQLVTRARKRVAAGQLSVSIEPQAGALADTSTRRACD